MEGKLRPDQVFAEVRPVLVRAAYRMLGSVSDAEDVVQDAWIRWSAADRSDVREPVAFLRQIVVRLCLDVLKSGQRRQETYVGPWLPEPVVEDDAVDDITLPLLLTLQRLSPLERAAFLLHDVFGEPFEDIAETLDRDVGACRQLASRARLSIRQDRPKYSLERDRALEIAAAFFAASRRGDLETLESMLTADAELHADGGGKRPAVAHVVKGADQISRILVNIAHILAEHPSKLLRYGFINGLPGFVTVEADGLQTTALLIDDERIKAIYVMRNPDKLRHLGATVH